MGRHTTFAFRILSAALLLFMLPAGSPAQNDPPIPAGKIRIHYFRPDGNYLGWTVYAFGDTTENIADFKGGPVKLTGQDNFGAYFDVGVSPTARSVGIVIHKGNIKDPGPDLQVNPAAEGSEYWELSGSNLLQRTRPQRSSRPIPRYLREKPEFTTIVRTTIMLTGTFIRSSPPLIPPATFATPSTTSPDTTPMARTLMSA